MEFPAVQTTGAPPEYTTAARKEGGVVGGVVWMKRKEKVEDGDDHAWLVEAERVEPGLTAVAVTAVNRRKTRKAKNRKVLRYMLCFGSFDDFFFLFQ